VLCASSKACRSLVWRALSVAESKRIVDESGMDETGKKDLAHGLEKLNFYFGLHPAVLPQGTKIEDSPASRDPAKR
jgi:hypothetical protein